MIKLSLKERITGKKFFFQEENLATIKIKQVFSSGLATFKAGYFKIGNYGSYMINQTTTIEVTWNGPYSWPSFENENNLNTIPKCPGVYLQTFEYKEG